MRLCRVRRQSVVFTAIRAQRRLSSARAAIEGTSIASHAPWCAQGNVSGELGKITVRAGPARWSAPPPRSADGGGENARLKISWVIGVHFSKARKVTPLSPGPSAWKQENRLMKVLTFVRIRWDRRGSHLPRRGSFAARVAWGFLFPSSGRGRAEATRRGFSVRGDHRQTLPTEDELRDLF